MKEICRIFLCAGMIIGLLFLSASGCVRVPPSVPPATPCVSFAGTWNTNAGPVEIIQDECYVTGTFPSPIRFHSIRGAVRGSKLEFDWEGPLGTGRGIVTIDGAGNSFSGTFGYDTSTSGGAFTATRGVWPETK